jgi:nucleotide-binding universal stress UspA family protein
MVIIFIAFQGYDIIVQCSEEVENPKKNIPKAIFISLIVVVAFYLLIMFVAIGATPTEGGQASWEYLGEKEETAMVDAADKFLPYLGIGFIIMMVGGLVSTMSALNATIFSSSRVSFAMGRDGTLPRSFGKIDPVRRTPSTAIWATGAMILIMVVSIPMEDVAASASLLFLGLFIMANISLIILRRKRPDLDRGFMVPLFPWIPLAAIAINTLLIAFLVYNWPLSGWIALAWIEGGLLLYYFTSGEEEITSIDKVEKYIGAKAVPTGKDYHVLVPISNPKSTPLLDLSGVVADRRDGDVVLLNIAKVPNNTPIRDVDPTFMQKHVAVAEVVKGYAEKSGVTTRAKVVVSHTIGDTILAEGKAEKANLIILGWMGPKTTRKWLFGYNLDPVIQNAKCDVAVLKSGSFKEVKRIVFAAGYEVNELHSVRAARVAAMLAKRYNIPVEIMMLRRGGVPSDARAKEQLERLKGIFLKRGVGAVGEIVSTSDPVQAVTSKVTKVDLLVMGASDKWKSYRYAFGPMQDTISSRARSGLLYYRAGTLEDVTGNGVKKGGASGGGKSAKDGGRKSSRGGGRKTTRKGAGKSRRASGGSAHGEGATGFDDGGGFWGVRWRTSTPPWTWRTRSPGTTAHRPVPRM